MREIESMSPGDAFVGKSGLRGGYSGLSVESTIRNTRSRGTLEKVGVHVGHQQNSPLLRHC